MVLADGLVDTNEPVRLQVHVAGAIGPDEQV